MFSTVYLAAEDAPGLAVGRKLVSEVPPLTVYREENGHGYGTLKRKTPGFHQMGENGLPVLMITDLDDAPCASGLINRWLGHVPSDGFMFRVCVREVEAWLLAHRDAMADFLKVPVDRIPREPECLPNPKAKLVELAQLSRQRRIRIGFEPVGTARIGPEHNDYLCKFVEDWWTPSIAGLSAPSLERARRRLQILAASVDT